MKKVYRQNVIDALAWLADYEFQKVAWFPNSQGLMASYNENVAWVFEDTGLKEALNAGDVIFDAQADAALRALKATTDTIDGNVYSEETLLHMPKMHIIREKAAHALILIKASRGQGSTIDLV